MSCAGGTHRRAGPTALHRSSSEVSARSPRLPHRISQELMKSSIKLDCKGVYANNQYEIPRHLVQRASSANENSSIATVYLELPPTFRLEGVPPTPIAYTPT